LKVIAIALSRFCASAGVTAKMCTFWDKQTSVWLCRCTVSG